MAKNPARRRQTPLRPAAARPRRRWLAPVIGLAAALIVLGVLWPALQRADRIGGPFTLTGENGQPVSSRAFRGKYQLIYFGYTHCPDLCPLTLARMAAAIKRLGPAGQRIVPVFITIDPARDTPGIMKHYTGRFSNRIVGLTGSAGQIARVAREFHVYYRRPPTGSHDTAYDMDHSTSLYVIGPEGRFIAAFGTPATTADLVAELERLIGPSGIAAS